jgi:hypothetical protein
MDFETRSIRNLYFFLNKYMNGTVTNEILYRLRMMDKILLSTPNAIHKILYMADWSACMRGMEDDYFGIRGDLYIHFTIIRQKYREYIGVFPRIINEIEMTPAPAAQQPAAQQPAPAAPAAQQPAPAAPAAPAPAAVTTSCCRFTYFLCI